MNNIFYKPSTAKKFGYKVYDEDRLGTKFYIAWDKNDLCHLIMNGKPFKKYGKPIIGKHYRKGVEDGNNLVKIFGVDGRVITVYL